MTIFELDNQLRALAQHNPIIGEVLRQHHGQFTTEALYKVAIALDKNLQQAAALNIVNVECKQLEDDCNPPNHN